MTFSYFANSALITHSGYTLAASMWRYLKGLFNENFILVRLFYFTGVHAGEVECYETLLHGGSHSSKLL
jgi:hypothetical protein